MTTSTRSPRGEAATFALAGVIGFVVGYYLADLQSGLLAGAVTMAVHGSFWWWWSSVSERDPSTGEQQYSFLAWLRSLSSRHGGRDWGP